MGKTSSPLIERIRTKCQQEGWYGPALFGPPWHDITGDLRRTGFAYPKATLSQLEATEEGLGMRIPEALASLYTHLANGGFGPGCGIRGAAGGYRWYEQTLAEAYQSYRATHVVDLLGQWRSWPGSLLPLCDLGCDQDVCLDCQAGYVVIVAPTQQGREIVPLMRMLAPSLDAWLAAWLSEEPVL